MEEIYFAAAVASFALAVCSLVASIVIFARADVLSAIRFLRHQPVKQSPRGSMVIPKATPKKGGRLKAGASMAGSAVGEQKRANQPTTVVEATEELSERPTGLLEEDSERPTGVLDEEPSEHPTDVLDLEPSERPTGLLAEDASSLPAGHEGGPAEHSKRPTGSMSVEASERPTGLLGAEPSERPTDVLASQEPLQEGPARASAVAQHEETTFRFILKHNEVVAHTEETIG